MAGSRISARARLVCGPSMAMVMLWGLAANKVSIRKSMALPSARPCLGSYTATPGKPSSPWTCSA
ncbi:hypothetical protein D3C78_1630040 [compost metagenome]